MYAIQLVFSVPVYDNHWSSRNILIKVTLSNYNGSTNVGHLKAVIPNQICITWRVTLVNNYHRACWVSCANMIFVLKIVAVSLTTMPATRAEDITACNLISESWILWQHTFLCRTLFKPCWRTGSFMLSECHLVLWLCSTPVCLFSASTSRWNMLKNSLSEVSQKVLTVKKLSDARWWARASALKALLTGYWNIQAAGYSSFTKLEDRLHDDIVAWHLETLWCM